MVTVALVEDGVMSDFKIVEPRFKVKLPTIFETFVSICVIAVKVSVAGNLYELVDGVIVKVDIVGAT